MSLLRRLLGLKSAPLPQIVPITPPAPAERLYVIGDIHGSLDLLDRLLDRIDTDSATVPAHLVTVGDYIDRGEASAQVLDRLHDLQTGAPDAVTCLMGNHEKLMLDFLRDPEGRGGRWLRNGGLQTLASYGVGQVTEASGPDQLRSARDALAKALPAHIAGWIDRLPMRWQSGNIVVTHAALDPALPPDQQETRTMLWGHADFLERPRTDGRWVVHGHTVFDQPGLGQSRIWVDTGAYFSGKLTAAAIEPSGEVRFLQT